MYLGLHHEDTKNTKNTKNTKKKSVGWADVRKPIVSLIVGFATALLLILHANVKMLMSYVLDILEYS